MNAREGGRRGGEEATRHLTTFKFNNLANSYTRTHTHARSHMYSRTLRQLPNNVAHAHEAKRRANGNPQQQQEETEKETFKIQKKN